MALAKPWLIATEIDQSPKFEDLRCHPGSKKGPDRYDTGYGNTSFSEPLKTLEMWHVAPEPFCGPRLDRRLRRRSNAVPGIPALARPQPSPR
jgi:hypothetical protein